MTALIVVIVLAALVVGHHVGHNRIPDAVGRLLERARPGGRTEPGISLSDVADLPDGRDRWIRWDQELTTTCPECGRAWADHPGGFEVQAVDGHLGRVLPECSQESGHAQ